MEVPCGSEVNIYDLVPGEEYYGFVNPPRYASAKHFRGRFVEYYRNSTGYLMIRFYPAIQEYYGEMLPIPSTNPLGLYLRIFENGNQSYRYYRASRFTAQQKKEIYERAILHERRQYERGLTGTKAITGTTGEDIWLPRDIVREISLKYLTDFKINRPKRKSPNTHSIISRT
jgi:hypothetical protein